MPYPSVALIGLMACNNPTAPRTPLAQHLLGTWDLIYDRQFPIPGWVRFCPALAPCDSVYIEAGQLTFQPGSVCSRVSVLSGQSPFEQSCSYGVGADRSALVIFEGVAESFSALVGQDPGTHEWTGYLTLVPSGPPCLDTVFCSIDFNELYRKKSP